MLLLYSVYHPLVEFLHSFWDCCHSHCTACTLFLSGWLSVHVFRIGFAIISSSLSTAALEVSHRTRSSANSMAQGGSLSISEASTSMMVMKSRGLIADPWCSPTFTLKYSVFPSLVVTLVSQSSYISWMILMYASGTLFFRRLHHINSLGTLSYAFSRSTKIIILLLSDVISYHIISDCLVVISYRVSGQSCVGCRMLLMTKSHHQRDDSSPVDKEEVQDIGQVGQLC